MIITHWLKAPFLICAVWLGVSAVCSGQIGNSTDNAGVALRLSDDELLNDDNPESKPAEKSIQDVLRRLEALEAKSISNKDPTSQSKSLALAGDTEKANDKVEAKPDSKIESTKPEAKPKPSFSLGGQLVMDALWFSQSTESRNAVQDVQDAFGFRRARLYGQGKFEAFNYATGFDFAQGTGTNGRPTFLDNYIGISDMPVVQNLRVGHFFEPFTLERTSSNRNVMFMERSLSDAFAPARNLGFMIFGTSPEDSFYWAIGSFRSDTDNFGDDAGDNEGQSIDARLVYRPYYDTASDGRNMMHIGGGYIYRYAAEGVTQYRSRPEAFGNADAANLATPYFVDTGSIASRDNQLLGAEFLMIHGPLAFQSEYVYAPVRTEFGPTLAFSGGYVATSLFLTGEHRRYNRETASLDRVIPTKNFSPRRLMGDCNAGLGAWELAARLSFIDLSDGPIEGGRLDDFTTGIDWYLTPYNRFKFNYILANLDRFQQSTQTHVFAMRFDMDF